MNADRAPAPYRVFIIEDHPVFSRGLSQLIAEDKGLLLCGVADARTALEDIARTRVDVLTVDLSLEGANGMDLLKTVKAEYPAIRSLVISMHDESLYGERALRAGASGYVMKQEAGETMLRAIHAVARGEMWVSEALTAKMIRKVVHGPGAGSGSPLHILSDRELEIFQHIGRGQSTQEIGRNLHISVKTVESHRANIREKLAIKSNLDLIRHAMQWVYESKP